MKAISKYIGVVILLFLAVANTSAQNYEEEIGFTFVKAKYLFETDRFDDAIREFNRVINENPSLEDVLVYRASAKYKLSAYVGTKKDILKYIELKGVTAEAVTLLAKAEYQLSEFDAAMNSLSTALVLVKNDKELYEFRASIRMDRDLRLGACEDWEAAARLGSTKALAAAENNCGFLLKKKEDVIIPPATVPETELDENESSSVMSSAKEKINTTVEDAANSTVSEIEPIKIPDSNTPQTVIDTSTGIVDTMVVFEAEPEIDPRLLDESENEIVIDEDLTLVIKGQGLGSRELLKQPNILILSDEEGEVVIDVCVSRGGRIISSQFNEKKSTLKRKSLVSLALRKSKDFWFDKSDLIEQCGQIIFKVSGT